MDNTKFKLLKLLFRKNFDANVRDPYLKTTIKHHTHVKQLRVNYVMVCQRKYIVKGKEIRIYVGPEEVYDRLQVTTGNLFSPDLQ